MDEEERKLMEELEDDNKEGEIKAEGIVEKPIQQEVELPPLTLSMLNFPNVDISKCNFELDALQNQMLQFYLMNDERFRRAYNTNYTPHLIQFMKDKARLHEPLHLSIIGKTRSSKSYISVSIAIIHSLLNGRQFSGKYICGNSFEFIEKLKEMPPEDLLNSIFLIDEEKKSVYGAGSVSKKMKITDVQNIIAINNISTISLTPDHWANENADYGMRTFGRDFTNKVSRLMLYNLQEGGKGGSVPLGMIVLPIFTKLLPKPYAEILEKEYLEKKMAWVGAEQSGRGDVLSMIKMKSAESFVRDIQFLDLKKKKERFTYIQTKLGSEWTKSECDEILSITEMLRRGVDFKNG